ncbi:MAG: polysaccharide biosynthesis protein [Anaerolineaceae bacterium]|nr:polysaccharide biosynthesis protein [Anaerolineaceae bacterium]
MLKPFVYFLFGMYRRMWIYASTKELRLVIISVSTASLFVATIMLLLFYLDIFSAFPRSVLIIDWVLSLVLIGGSRFLLRLVIESRGTANYLTDNPRLDRVLIVGAGDAGAIVVKELQKTPKLNLIPIGFLDDDPTKKNMVINDIRVIGTVTEIQKVLENYQVDEVIIAIPSAPGRVARLVTDGCHKFDIPFRTIPGIYELIEGSVGVSRLRTVQITDLLRRKPTRLNDDMIRMKLQDKAILVTGAGGSIGSELCRQISRRHPDVLYLLGHGENSIFEIHQELKENHPSVKTIPIIADIRDNNRLKTVFKRYTPQIVFHAAAHKHVPLMEYNIEEAITNNVIGTANIVKLCTEFNIERLVMISTDKAIHPINIMGASKRMAEMVVLDEAQRVKADYSVVRFGNVLGSRGSVVPIFKNQIAKGGPVTITHPDMKRYFMTIPEAVYLVLQSATFGKCGDIFVLNMGEQTRILDLAEDLIRLSGLEPGRDIEIVFTGIRPGDKLSEDLWDEGHIFKPTPHPDIFRLDDQNNLKNDELETVLYRLNELAVTGKSQEIIKTLEEVIPDAKIETTQVEYGNNNA